MATYNGRSTFVIQSYLKTKLNLKSLVLYEIPYDTSDPANRFCPNGEETVTLEKESRSKLDKDKVKNHIITYQNSLYETLSHHPKTYLEHAFPNPTAKSMEVLIKTLLMPLSNKTILDSHCFVHELKTEMHDDLEYVKSLEKEIDELESEKADFSNIYDLLLEECVSLRWLMSYLHSLSDLNANTELQCLYLHKVKECECLAQKLSKQTESVNNEVHNKLLKSFAKLEKHSISLELSLQHCKEQMKNNTVCKRNGLQWISKERELYHEIQDFGKLKCKSNSPLLVVSRPQLKCYQVKDKVRVQTIVQGKFQKKEVEGPIIGFLECGKCVFNSNHDACVSRYLKDVNARTKKPREVPISASKPKRKANKSVATPHKKTVASDTTIQKSKSYYKKLYENTNQEWKWWIAKRCPSGYTWTQKPLRTKKIWMPKVRKNDESTSVSPTIDIVSRITNILKISNFIGSNLSNIPSSSNSLADCTTHPIHC
ncbi:hypothetical protein Tco_0515457 [Tanacetum coccineum]